MTERNQTSKCDMHELLITYLYDEASRDEALRFEAHLIECPACRQELSAFESVRQSLQQWQLNEFPSVRLAMADNKEHRRSFLAVLKELFAIMPLWAKGLGALATAVLVLAILGTNVSIGKEGFSFRADLLRRNQPVAARSDSPTIVETVKYTNEQLETLRAELLSKVNALIADSTKQQQEEVRAQLINFQSQLKDMRAADLTKIANRVQQHNMKIQALERDLDRREGLGLSDILMSDDNRRVPPAPKPSGDE
jgi:hypothetical protein